MRGVLNPIFELCLLRGSPRDLPYSTTLMTGLLLGSVALSLFAGQWLGMESSLALPRTLLWLVVHLLVLRALLVMRGVPTRFVQTISAFAGTSILISLMLLPISRSVYVATHNPEHPVNPLLVLLWIAVFAWSFIVDAHILRQAMQITLSTGLMIAVLMFTVRSILDRLLFSGATPT